MSKVLNQITGLLAHLLDWILSVVVSFFPEERKTEFDADFISENELLSEWNKGFCINGRKSLTISDSTKHVLITGATGAYKSSGILIPSIQKMCEHSSLIVNDNSGELWAKTSGTALKKGCKVLTTNYALPSLSEGYNPLARIHSTSDIQRVAKMIVINALGVGTKDPFWNMAAENIISLFIAYLMRHTSKQYHTLHNVYYLVSTFAHNPEAVDKLVVEANDDVLFTEYKAFLSYGDKTLASIIATARAALNIFGNDPSVALVTSHDTISINSFRKQRTVLYINTSINSMRYFSLITSLFLEQMFGELMSGFPEKKDLPIFFLIDEASSLYFNSLQITISNLRKYNAGILQIYQSASQLVDLYGPPVAKAITENSYTRVYMPGQPMSVATELETTFGKFEYLDEKNVRHIRSLMTASEIRETDSSLILCGNHRPIKTKTVPYFKQFGLNRLTNTPPAPFTNKLPFEEPPRIKL